MAAIERIMAGPFEWGPCDCCSAACDVFAALWGIDPMASVRGYRGALQAARLMRVHGGLGPLADLLATRAQLGSGHHVGGIAISPEGARQRSLLICIEPGLWAGKSARGFAILRAAEKGWHA